MVIIHKTPTWLYKHCGIKSIHKTLNTTDKIFWRLCFVLQLQYHTSYMRRYGITMTSVLQNFYKSILWIDSAKREQWQNVVFEARAIWHWVWPRRALARGGQSPGRNECKLQASLLQSAGRRHHRLPISTDIARVQKKDKITKTRGGCAPELL